MAGSNLQVRAAPEADLPALIRLKPSPVVHRDRLRDARQAGFHYLVVQLELQVIGFVCLVFVRPRYWSDGESTEQLPTAIDFVIDESLRSRGYGSFFLSEVERLAAAANARELYLWVDAVENPRALTLYKRLGFRPIQERPYPFHWEFVDSDGLQHGGDNWRLDLVKTLA